MTRRSWARTALGLALMTSAGAGAAAERRTVPAPATIEGLADCPNGGFVLPGSTSCIRLSGSARVTATLATGSGAAQAVSLRLRDRAIQADARVSADVRIPTELGPLRAYGSVRVGDPSR